MPATKFFSVLTRSEISWSVFYLSLAWLAQLGNGAIQTITGPMQPYLAYNLQTDTQTINLVWTLGFSGFLIGSLGTSYVFTRYLNTSTKKLVFMSAVLLTTGVSTILMPFMPNLLLLLLCRFFQVRNLWQQCSAIIYFSQILRTFFTLFQNYLKVPQLWYLSDCRQHPPRFCLGT